MNVIYNLRGRYNQLPDKNNKKKPGVCHPIASTSLFLKLYHVFRNAAWLKPLLKLQKLHMKILKMRIQ